MGKAVCILIVLLGLANSPTAKEEHAKRVVLPNAKLLRCKSADCRLWPDGLEQAELVYPKQFILDTDQSCVYGMEVLYDKSIGLEDVKREIDAHYGKWAVAGFESSPIKLWRVESERFSIQLSTANKKDAAMHVADEGTKQVIYIAFGGRSACNAPAN